MAPNHQTSPNPDDQKPNPERSNSSSSSLDIGEFTLSLQDTQPRRASLHQRSASDSVAFVKKPYLVGPGSCHSSNIGAGGCLKLAGGDAADGKAIDHNMEISEDSSSASSHHPTQLRKWSRNFDPDMDPKKIKRLLANRVSAHKSRLRKAEYIEKLERDMNIEQAKVSLLAPQVSFYEVQRMILQKENTAMKQRLEILEEEKAKKDDEYRALKDERDILAFTYFLIQEGL